MNWKGLKIIGFNTGRQYTPKGQRIIAVQLKPEYDDILETEYAPIIFEDIDRMITGRMTTRQLNQHDIMQGYDNGGYECLVSIQSVLPTFNLNKVKKELFGE